MNNEGTQISNLRTQELPLGLSGMEWPGAGLSLWSGAELPGVVLSGAELPGAELSGAELSGMGPTLECPGMGLTLKWLPL